jgi:hypothetical protein
MKFYLIHFYIYINCTFIFFKIPVFVRWLFISCKVDVVVRFRRRVENIHLTLVSQHKVVGLGS